MKIVRLFILFLFSAVLFSTCTTDDNVDPADARDQFLGTWNVSESCAKDAYSVVISKDPSNSSQVLIQNFWNTGNCSDPPYAIIAGSSMVIPKQSICEDSFEVQGNASISKAIITLDYTVNTGADLFSCNATYSHP